jgi:hypothetical protein
MFASCSGFNTAPTIGQYVGNILKNVNIYGKQRLFLLGINLLNIDLFNYVPAWRKTRLCRFNHSQKCFIVHVTAFGNPYHRSRILYMGKLDKYLGANLKFGVDSSGSSLRTIKTNLTMLSCILDLQCRYVPHGIQCDRSNAPGTDAEMVCSD